MFKHRIKFSVILLCDPGSLLQKLMMHTQSYKFLNILDELDYFPFFL